MEGAHRTGSAWRVLRHRDFAIIWSAALVSNSGSWMQQVAVPFVIYRMTHSTTWLGIAATAAFVPNMLSSLAGGTFADRYSRRRILLVTQVLLMLTAFALWAVWVKGIATPGLIVSLMVVVGLIGGFAISAWQSFIVQLVDPEELVDAVKVNSLQFTGARAFGPALAGIVLEVFGASGAFLFNALTFLLVLVALVIIRPRPQTYSHNADSFTRRFRDGVRVVRHDLTLMLAVTTAGVTSFFGIAIVQLAPAIAKEFFHVGRGAYGLLVAAFGVGAVLGSVAVVSAHRLHRSAVAVYAAVGLSFAIMGLALAPSYGLGVAALVLIGLTYQMNAVCLTTAVQARVADSHRARVMSVLLAFVLLGIPLGALVGGKLASFISLRTVLWGYGGALLLLTVFASLRYDRLRALDEPLVREIDLDQSPAPVVGDPTG